MNVEWIKAKWAADLKRVGRDRMVTLIGEQTAHREDAEGRAGRLRKAGANVAADQAEAMAQLHAELRELTVREFYARHQRAS